MIIIQVRLDNELTEGMYGNYFNYEFGIADGYGVHFTKNRTGYQVDNSEYRLITRVE